MFEFKRVYLYLLAGLLVLLITGCSGGANSILPSLDNENQDSGSSLRGKTLTPADWAGHDPIAFCTFVINTEELTIDVVPNHTAAPHFNVRPLLEDPGWCPSLNCISAYVTGVDPVEKIYTVEVVLRNPSGLVGYDVRGIMYLKPSKPLALLNPDDYIRPTRTGEPVQGLRKDSTEQAVPTGKHI